MNLNKLYAVLVALLVMPALAVAEQSGDSMNALCQAKGFDFGIAKWQYLGQGPWTEVDSISGYNTSVVGNKNSVNWTATPAVDGVLTNGDSTVYPGGTSGGPITKGVNHNGNINQVTFCGYENEVPEFSTTVATVTIVGALAGLVAFRKRH